MIIDALRRGLDGHKLYLRITRQQIFARNVDTGEQFACSARVGVDKHNALRSIGDPVAPDCAKTVEPFRHSRVVVDDYDLAEQLLRFVCAKMMQTARFATAPLVVVHADMALQDGLSSIEARALHEMAISAGARRVVVHDGETLTDAQVRALLAEHRSV